MQIRRRARTPQLENNVNKPELLAPAGQPDAAYAALQYGADAVYLGLTRFSARAEAINFTPADLTELAAYAHSLPQPKKIYLTLNTLVKQSEFKDALHTLADAALAGIDAIIVQDLGLAQTTKKLFPDIPLHASTQMTIHNLDSALAAQDLGYKRATLARELTLKEIAHIRKNCTLEIETFIHGTLCYSYSGLCLFSSLLTGRSGNRGRCAYSCRESAHTPDGGRSHPFSLKDMALGERIVDLARAGVDSLKIEGRKKGPLYVAATVDYYRKILDGQMTPELAAETEARLKTIFARPWTKLFIDSPRNPDAADPEVVGHRGSPIGTVERLVRTPAGPGIVFRPNLPIERHDGLQIDLPGESRPLGFGVDNLYAVHGKKLDPVFAAPAETDVAVALPEDAAPPPRDAPLYLSSSQAVKRSYPFRRPKAGDFAPRLATAVEMELQRGADADDAVASYRIVLAPPAPMNAAQPVILTGAATLPAFPARDAAGAEAAARGAFERMGAEPFRLVGWTFANPDRLFVRPGDWNRLRRDILAELRAEYRRAEAGFFDAVAIRGEKTDAEPAKIAPAPAPDAPGWILQVARPEELAEFVKTPPAECEEATVTVPLRPDPDFAKALDKLAEALGRERVRLAAPVIDRYGLSENSHAYIDTLYNYGWRRWLAPSLGVWRRLREKPGADLVADWTLYALNIHSVRRFLEMGFSSCTLSPEDDAANLRDVLAFWPGARVVVYAELPLFISAACAHAHLGRCRRDDRKAKRCAESGRALRVRLEKSGGVEIWPQQCGSVATSVLPYTLCDELAAIRAMGGTRFVVDLRWRPHRPEEVAAIWRDCVAGRKIPGLAGNFRRGLL